MGYRWKDHHDKPTGRRKPCSCCGKEFAVTVQRRMLCARCFAASESDFSPKVHTVPRGRKGV